MALQRIGSTSRPAGIPSRQPVLPGSAAAPGGLNGATAAAPASPVLDGAEGRPLPQSGVETLAAALAEMQTGADSAAMRPNQVFLSRQLVWQPPNTAMMAASWQVMVRTYGEQRAAWLEQASGRHMPSSLFMADHTPAAMRDGRPGQPLVTELEPWRFAVYAWGAEQLVLKVVIKEEDEYERERRKRSRVALRLELMLPGVGRVVIQMEPAGGNGVVMEVGAAQTSAMQHMRELLPQLAAMVSRSGLTILRCRLRRELAPSSAQRSAPTRLHTAALTQAIFRAMAELAVLLSQPLPLDDLFSESA